MAIQQKGDTSPAFRYFVFILCLCIFLFVFLVTRLLSGEHTSVYNTSAEKHAYHVEVSPPIPLEKTHAYSTHHSLPSKLYTTSGNIPKRPMYAVEMQRFPSPSR